MFAVEQLVKCCTRGRGKKLIAICTLYAGYYIYYTTDESSMYARKIKRFYIRTCTYIHVYTYTYYVYVYLYKNSVWQRYVYTYT